MIFQYPYALVMVLYLTYKSRKDLVRHQIWPLFAGATLGLPIGFYFIHNLPEASLKIMLSFFILSFVIISVLLLEKILHKIVSSSKITGTAFGFFSGAFQGAYNTGGPPVVIYALTIHENKFKAKGIMISIIAYLFIFLLIPYTLTGAITASGLLKNLYYSPAVVLGTLAGSVSFKKVDNSIYRKVILMLLMVTSIFLLVRSL